MKNYILVKHEYICDSDGVPNGDEFVKSIYLLNLSEKQFNELSERIKNRNNHYNKFELLEEWTYEDTKWLI